MSIIDSEKPQQVGSYHYIQGARSMQTKSGKNFVPMTLERRQLQQVQQVVGKFCHFVIGEFYS